MWSVEHGPDRDDEVNLLRPGMNAGCHPVPGYNETVPMTDLSLANAQPAAWSTGVPTLALAGGAWLEGSQWGSWEGALTVASLKNRSLRLLLFSEDGQYLGQEVVIDGDHGRLRAVEMANDGSLLVTTSNGTDELLRLTAR